MNYNPLNALYEENYKQEEEIPDKEYRMEVLGAYLPLSFYDSRKNSLKPNTVCIHPRDLFYYEFHAEGTWRIINKTSNIAVINETKLHAWLHEQYDIGIRICDHSYSIKANDAVTHAFEHMGIVVRI